MRADWSHMEQYRITTGELASKEGDKFGAFSFMQGTERVVVIASSGDEQMPWEHVSVRVDDYKHGKHCRIPRWQEMCVIKAAFWDEEECVVQYHPPRSEYVNRHNAVLHLWRPLAADLPRPPKIAV